MSPRPDTLDHLLDRRTWPEQCNNCGVYLDAHHGPARRCPGQPSGYRPVSVLSNRETRQVLDYVVELEAQLAEALRVIRHDWDNDLGQYI